MKSGKQRRKEIKTKRLKKAEEESGLLKTLSYEKAKLSSLSVVESDLSQLVHNNTCATLPRFYIDTAFVCIECGIHDLWTAKSQKWWYEIAKGSIWSTASRCSTCRKKRREKKEKQKNHMGEMAKRKPHPNEAFFKNT